MLQGGRSAVSAVGALAVVTMTCALSSQASAQVLTTVTPDVVATLTTGTTVTRTGPGDRAVVIQGGRYAGPASNPRQTLFHSFQQFDLAGGDIAIWAGSGSTGDVRHLINRVTGGDRSDIYGTLDSSAFPNADFYFINPAGIVFGEDFSIRVPQSFYVSTAASLNFADGTHLLAASGNGSTFSSAPPASFGFIGGATGDLTFTRAAPTSFVSWLAPGRDGRTAHFSASNITFSNTFLPTADLAMRLAATGAMTTSISVDPRTALPELAGALTLQNSSIVARSVRLAQRGADAALAISAGDIRLIGGTQTDRATGFETGGQGEFGGDLDIQASRLFMSGHSHIGGVAATSAEPFVVTLRLRDLLQMRGLQTAPSMTQIGTSPSGATVGNARFRILGDRATLDIQDASIDVRAGSGRTAGSLEIDVDRIVGNRARFIATSGFPTTAARGGDLSLRARQIALTDSRIDNTTGGGGDAGSIRLFANDLDLLRTTLFSSTSGGGTTGEGGSITIHAGRGTITGSDIASSTSSSGRAGSIQIEGETLDFTDSTVRTSATGTINGAGGDIRIDANTLTFLGGRLDTASASQANAGSILLHGRALRMTGTTVQSVTSGAGAGGSIELGGDDIRLDAVNMASTSFASGASGGISLAADGDLSIVRSTIASETGAGGGRAGSIRATGSSATLVNTSFRATTGGSGDAGNIEIVTPGALRVTAGQITNSTFAGGRSGLITLSGGSVDLSGGLIQAVSLGQGASGDIRIQATQGSITAAGVVILADATGAVAAPGLSAAGAAGSIRLTAADDVRLSDTSIASTAANRAARAGSIDIAAGRQVAITASGLAGAPSAAISVASSSSAPTGSSSRPGITITGRDISIQGLTERLDRAANLSDRVRIVSETSGAQDAATVTLRAIDTLSLERADLISQSARGLAGQSIATGRAGDVVLASRDVTVRNTIIEAASSSLGDAGSINLASTGDLLITDRSVLSSAASGRGRGGSIDIALGRSALLNGLSRIDTDISGEARASGGIRIVGRDATLTVSGTDPLSPLLSRSAVSSSTGNDQEGGRVTIDVGALRLLDGGSVLAIAVTGARGNGGGVFITADHVLLDGALSGIQATALGSGNAGAIGLTARRIVLDHGADISTNAVSGRAGDISILMPDDGILEIRDGRPPPSSPPRQDPAPAAGSPYPDRWPSSRTADRSSPWVRREARTSTYRAAISSVRRTRSICWPSMATWFSTPGWKMSARGRLNPIRVSPTPIRSSSANARAHGAMARSASWG